MLLVWKNKGLLVLLYLLVSIIGTAMIVGVLHRNVEGVLSNIDFYTTFGLGFLIASLWTYLTKDDFYKDKDGNKKKIEFKNEFFWISMKIWAYIYFAVSMLFLGNLLFNYFEPIN
jgi:uncharacterized membrane protein